MRDIGMTLAAGLVAIGLATAFGLHASGLAQVTTAAGKSGAQLFGAAEGR